MEVGGGGERESYVLFGAPDWSVGGGEADAMLSDEGLKDMLEVE